MSLPNRAFAFASRWFDEATVRGTFEPLVADWQREWQEAPASTRRWVAVRGLFGFIHALVVSSPSILSTSAPSSVTNLVVLRIGGFTIAGTIAIMGLQVALGAGAVQGGWLLFLVPSTMSAIFPFAMTGAVDAIRRGRLLPAPVERAAIVKVAIGAVLVMMVFGGWVVPATNQAFRVSSMPPAAAAPIRGVRELTTLQLIFDASLAAEHEPFTGGADRAVRVRRELNNRAALLALPIVILWLRWRALDLPHHRWVNPLPATIASIVAIAAWITLYFSGFRIEQEWQLSPGFDAWLPIAVFATWGLAAPYCRRQLVALG